jgi:hypothetical protein
LSTQQTNKHTHPLVCLIFWLLTDTARTLAYMLQELCTLPIPHTANQQQLQALHWAPALGRPREMLAASFGTTAAIYSLSPAASPNDSAGAGQQQQQPDQQQPQLLGLRAEVIAELEHPVAVWKLEFNLLGNTLGCSLDGVPEIWFWMSRMSAEHEEPVWQVVSKSEC